MCTCMHAIYVLKHNACMNSCMSVCACKGNFSMHRCMQVECKHEYMYDYDYVWLCVFLMYGMA